MRYIVVTSDYTCIHSIQVTSDRKLRDRFIIYIFLVIRQRFIEIGRSKYFKCPVYCILKYTCL